VAFIPVSSGLSRRSRRAANKWPALDWSPKNYWPAGTQVHVESDIYGLDFGGGYYGGPDPTSDSTIGRNQVVLATAQSYQIVIQRDGQTVATYPAPFGNGDIISDPNRVTRSGVHIVMDKQQTTTMSNPAYGYTNVIEHWAVRISDNGECIHPNQNTVADQGNTKRQPRLHQPVRGQCAGLLRVRDLRRNRSRSPAPASRCPPPTATSTTGPSPGTNGSPCPAIRGSPAESRGTRPAGLSRCGSIRR